MNVDIFIKRPVLSTVISILIVILGIIGLVSLPVEQYPDIAPPTISVSTSYTGADARTILNSVIAPLEDAINGVEDMNYMVSKATNDGNAQVTVFFRQGTDPNMAAINVQNRVAKATNQLPAEVVRVGVTTRKRQTSTLLVFSAYSPDNRYNETFIENYLKINVVPQILRVKGVGDAMAFGTHDYSMRIWLRPDVMAEYKLQPSDITAALAQQNIEAAPGKFGENSKQAFQYVLRYTGRLTDPIDYENIVLSVKSSGEALRLGDVARIEMNALSSNIISGGMGHPGASVAVYQMPGSNATQVIKDVQKVVAEAAQDFPAGMAYAEMQNSNDFLYASINKVLRTLIEAFLLVFLVVFLFLQDFRSTLIPAVAVPVAIIGTFFFLKIFGFSINLLTLFALVLAIAIVVDDAIVVVEAVHAKLDHNYDSAQVATSDAMREITGAIVSITLVMAAVFIPVTFVSGTSGIFYTQFGLTLAVAIMLSAVNALTLSPALCALFLKPHREKPVEKRRLMDYFFDGFNRFFEKTTQSYKKSVQRFIRFPYLAFACVAVFVLMLVLLIRYTPKGLVPNEDNGVMFIGVTLPPATTLYQTDLVMNRIDSLIAPHPAIKSRSKITGFGFISGNGSCYGNFIVSLKHWNERKDYPLQKVIDELTLRLKEEVKEAQIMIFSPPMISGFSATNGFEFSLQDKHGGEIEPFYEVSLQFIEALNQRPEIAFARTSFNPYFPQYLVEVDVHKCKQAGIGPSDVLSVMQAYFGGVYVSNFNRFGKLYRVMIQGEPQATTHPEDLKKVFVRTSKGMSPVEQFLKIKRVYGPENINRFNLFTSIAINGMPEDGYSSGDAIRAIEETAEETLPAGYGFEFSGITRNEQEAGNTVGLILALCLIFVYLLLCIQYESYILPLSVILSLPFGLAGSFLFVRMLGLNNNIYLQISLIMLIGLLAKNAILIIEFALQRRKQGLSIALAAVAGATARLRPILMTSLALIFGLLPLMFSFGVGSNGNRTIGAGAVGGMLIGMICQVLLVPVLFVVFEKWQEKVKPLPAPAAPNETPPTFRKNGEAEGDDQQYYLE